MSPVTIRVALLGLNQVSWKPTRSCRVTGDITLAEVQERLERLFAGWRRGDTPTKSLPIVAAPTRPRIFLMDRPGSEQSYIIAGQLIPPLNDDTELSLETMNDILGGSFTSRINMNLREDKAWSYGARTSIVDTEAQRLLLTIAPVQSNQTAASMVEIEREIRDYASTRPATDEEVATAKRRNTLSLPGRWETARSVARDIQDIVRFGLPDDYWDSYAERVQGLDTASVDEIARNLLTPDDLTWLVVGDLEQIESSIKELDIGEVTVIDTAGRIIN